MITIRNKTRQPHLRFPKVSSGILLILLMVLSKAAYGQTNEQIKTNVNNDTTLINEYIQSQVNGNTIVFDYKNIKQYWVSNTVFCNNNQFCLLLQKDKKDNKLKSAPLKIQLANVDDSMLCRVNVITTSNDFDFDIINKNNQVISRSNEIKSFITYYDKTACFSLFDTGNYSFDFVFSSDNLDKLNIERIVLSFLPKEKTIIDIEKNNVLLSNAELSEEDSFIMKGKRSQLVFKDKVIIPNDYLRSRITIKNIGNSPTHIYIGYSVHASNGEMINHRSFPYNNKNNVLEVVAIDKPGNKITVKEYPQDWAKNCYLALNAKEDLSDVPSTNFVDARILDVKKTANGQGEITFEKAFSKDIRIGDKVRIHGIPGAFLYTDINDLLPDEEKTFFSAMKRDDESVEYSSKAFSKGAYFVKPVVLSFSTNSNEENTILIKSFQIMH